MLTHGLDSQGAADVGTLLGHLDTHLWQWGLAVGPGSRVERSCRALSLSLSFSVCVKVLFQRTDTKEKNFNVLRDYASECNAGPFTPAAAAVDSGFGTKGGLAKMACSAHGTC